MFERFAERARQVVVLAQDEARSPRHNSIGTVHVVLGLPGVGVLAGWAIWA
jgi:ATP-dependent Clp protease ATP-binding subunit ClpC